MSLRPLRFTAGIKLRPSRDWSSRSVSLWTARRKAESADQTTLLLFLLSSVFFFFFYIFSFLLKTSDGVFSPSGPSPLLLKIEVHQREEVYVYVFHRPSDTGWSYFFVSKQSSFVISGNKNRIYEIVIIITRKISVVEFYYSKETILNSKDLDHLTCWLALFRSRNIFSRLTCHWPALLKRNIFVVYKDVYFMFCFIFKAVLNQP